MLILLLVFSSVIVYLILLTFVPKGNLINEVLALSQYWYKVFTLPKKKLKISRFKYGSHPRQYFLFYQNHLPPNIQKPLIIYFHGGAWGFGSPESFQNNAEVLIELGYEVVMPSYRRIPWHNYRHIREDLTLVMQKIKEVSFELGSQERKIILGGMSAGGHLAALLLYDREQLALSGFKAEDFNGLFLLAAPLQLLSMKKTPILWFLAGNRHSQLFSQANPINFISGRDKTPVLIIHGNKDGLVQYPAATDFYSKMEMLNPGVAKFHTLNNGSHLDVAKWVYREKGPREWLTAWLKTLE